MFSTSTHRARLTSLGKRIERALARLWNDNAVWSDARDCARLAGSLFHDAPERHRASPTLLVSRDADFQQLWRTGYDLARANGEDLAKEARRVADDCRSLEREIAAAQRAARAARYGESRIRRPPSRTRHSFWRMLAMWLFGPREAAAVPGVKPAEAPDQDPPLLVVHRDGLAEIRRYLLENRQLSEKLRNAGDAPAAPATESPE